MQIKTYNNLVHSIIDNYDRISFRDFTNNIDWVFLNFLILQTALSTQLEDPFDNFISIIKESIPCTPQNIATN